MQRGIKSTKEQELSPDSIAYLKSRGGGGGVWCSAACTALNLRQMYPCIVNMFANKAIRASDKKG